MVKRLIDKTKRKDQIAKTDKEYTKLVNKYSPANSLKNVGLTIILYREKESDKAEKQRDKQSTETTVNIDFAKGTTVEDAHEEQELLRQIGDTFPAKMKYNVKQFYIGDFNLTIDDTDRKWLKDEMEDRMLMRKEEATAEKFRSFCKFMSKHNENFSEMMERFGDSYLAAVYPMRLRDLAEGKTFVPKHTKNKDTEKLAAYYRYTTTELDMDATTFKDAISKGNYQKDECFINSIFDFYGDNLMRADKKRNVINRATILQTIGKTEENIKDGLSIEDVLPFFIKHKLTLKVFDKFYKMVAKHEPPTRNHHNKPMNCLMTDGHIYTLNHDIKRLEQKENESDHYAPTVCDTYYINEEAKPRKAKMIATIDDILQVVREMPAPEDPKEKQVLTLIHKMDNLTDLLYQFVGAGYSPGVNFESGRITALKLELNKIFCIIQTQQLIKSAIDGVVVVDNEEVYNNMNQAMSTLSSKLFLKNHLSFYTEKDSEVLDSYRTKPICGNLCMQQKSDKLIEIDVSKAYTSSFCGITEIPIFNEFDAFRPYEQEPVLPLNLYVVKGYSHPLATQDHALVYGKYLKDGMDIVAVKQPSFIKTVDYAKLVDEFYETKIADDAQQDVYTKKLIANVNIGLLEKCSNKKSVGYLFQDFDECKFYQAQHGGVIHSIQQIEDVSEVLERSPLGLDDDIDMVGSVISYKFVQRGDPYFVLVLKAEKRLRNGFRFVKELLLQEHNFKMMNAYDCLTEAGVKMVSVKTDCFTIPVDCETKAREVLAFDQGIGTWRVSKTDDIIFPFENLKHDELEAIEFKHLETQEIAITDEWDVSEMCKHFGSING